MRRPPGWERSVATLSDRGTHEAAMGLPGCHRLVDDQLRCAAYRPTKRNRVGARQTHEQTAEPRGRGCRRAGRECLLAQMESVRDLVVVGGLPASMWSGSRGMLALEQDLRTGNGLCKSRTSRPSCRGSVLTRRSPSGATFIASQRSWAGQSRMARRAERSEPRSGVLDSSEQTSYQGDRVRPAPHGARLVRTSAIHGTRAYCLKRRQRLPCLPQVTRSHGQKAET